jgi:hypothetical protein
MVDILINLREREERVKKGRKVMVQIKSYFRKNFKCEIRDYDGMNYKVRFSEKGQVILTEDIPRKCIDDWSLDKKPHTDYWKELFGRIEEEVNRPKGGELFNP